MGSGVLGPVYNSRFSAFGDGSVARLLDIKVKEDARFLGRFWILGLLLAAAFIFPQISLADTCTSLGSHTVIFSYTPQVGTAGVTRVYIIGGCFGATQGTGSVKIGGITVPSDSIFLWSDGEIGLTLPFAAQTGTLEVDSQDYGSDTSTNEANGNNWGWTGNGEISGTFTVYTASSPSFCCLDPAGPSAPQYIEGTWNYDYGGWETAQYSLTQGTRNIDGSYPISGSVAWTADPSFDADCTQPLTGTLYTQGILRLYVEDGDNGCGQYAEEWLVLNSGDVTSQGWFSFEDDPDNECSFPSDFPNGLGYACSDAPLVKTQTEIPTTETPAFLGWTPSAAGGDAVYGAWKRTLPLSSDGIVEFAGRFVFEQVAPGGGGIDGCYNAAGGASPFPAFTAVTGGEWYVNSSGIWASGYSPFGSSLLLSDYIGIPSVGLVWYQGHVGQCSIALYQTMFIDSVVGSVSYNSAGTNGSTNELHIDVNGPTGPTPNICTLVIPSGSSPGTPVCKQYP